MIADARVPASDTETTAAASRRDRSTAYGTVNTAVALVVAQAATALFMLVLARRTSLDSFGAYAGLYGASMSIGALLDFGSSQHQTRELARDVGRRHFRWWLRRRTLLQLPVVVVFGAVAVVLLADDLPLVCTLGLVAQALTYNLSQGSLAAVRATRTPIMAEWFVATGNVVLVASTVSSPDSRVLHVVGPAAAASWLVAALLGLWATRHTVHGRRDQRRPNPWTGSLSFGVSSFSTSIQGFALGAIGWTSGSAEAARIGAVQRWGQPIGLFASSYASFMFPAFAAAPSDRRAVRLLRPLRLFAGLGIVVAIVLIVVSPFLVDVLLGDQYQDATIVLRLLLLAAVPVLVAQPLASLLQARRDERFVAQLFVVVNLAVFVATVASSFVLGALSIPVFSLLGSCALLIALRGRLLRKLHSPASATHSVSA